MMLAPGAPAGTVVRRDGARLPASALNVAERVDPGEHRVTASAPGFATVETTVTLGKREKRVVVLELKPAAPAAPPPPAAPPAGTNGLRLGAFISGGVGLAGLVVGSVLGGLALAKQPAIHDHCRDEAPGVAVCDPTGKAARTSGVGCPSMAAPPPPSDPPPALVPAWLPALVAVVVSPAFLVKVKDYDVWWHLATGRWIIEHRALPTTDPFAYTMVDKPWHFVNGLAELILYAAYRAGGENGLVLLKPLFAILTLTCVGLCLREVRAARGTVIALVAATAFLVHARFTIERPMIMGAALLAGCQLAILRSHERRDRSHLVFLVALPLWPLVHGTALLGLAQLGALLVAALVAQAPRRRVVEIAGTLAACLVLSALLPWWRGLYYTAAGLGGGATATSFTAEWRTGMEALVDRVGHWSVLAGAVAGGLLMVRRNASLLVLSVAGAALSFQFARNAYEAMILAMPAFACAVEALSASLQRGGSALFARALAPITALAICVVQLVLAPVRTIGGPFGFGVYRTPFPYDTLVTLRRLPVHRLINGFPIGGFLIWENGPWGVYSDGRTVALYGEEDVKRLFLPMLESAEALTAAADRWSAVYGLDENLSIPFQWMMVSPDWVPVHLGIGTSLFVRRTHLAALPPDVKPLPLVRFTEDARWTRGFYAGILRDPELRAQLSREFAEAARRGPESPILVGVVGAVATLDVAYALGLEATLMQARGAGEH